MDIDQNLNRTDLLPATLPLAVLAALAVVGVVVWVIVHRALRRRRETVGARARFAILLPVGTAATWCLYQFAGRILFLAGPWPLWLASLATAASVEGISLFYERECAAIDAAIARRLVLMRMLAVATTLLILMQPVYVRSRGRPIRRRVAVLLDESHSMTRPETQWTPEERLDMAQALGLVATDERGETPAETFWNALPEERRAAIDAAVGLPRTNLVQAILGHQFNHETHEKPQRGGESALLERLASRYDVDLFRFGSDLRHIAELGDHEEDADEIAFQSSTDITRALEGVVEEIPSEELAGVLLFTDGRHTGDAGVEAVSRRLGQAGVPVSTVVVGGTRPPLDVAIADVRTAESVFLGDRVRLAIDLAATGAKGAKVGVRLFCGDEVVEETSFDIPSDDWAREVRFTDLPEERGVRRYRIEADVLDGEDIVENNRWAVDVSVSDDRTNVLLVDQRPRWEFRYLRNLFYGRDKSVHLQYWLVEPDTILGETPSLPAASAAREFGDAEAGALPVSRDEWRKFDVLIFGDVGEDVLTPEAVADIRHCVEERGALAVFIAGPKSMPSALRNPTLLELLPVMPGERSAGDPRRGPEPAFRFTLTPAGRAHEITPLSSSVSENEQIWQEQPDWHWRMPVEDIRPGAEVLAYAKATAATMDTMGTMGTGAADSADEAIARLAAIRRQQSRDALLVVRGQGRGRVAMLLSDSTWRLRYRVGDTYHHRLWGQIVRWGVGEKLRAGNTYVRLGTDQIRYTPHEAVKVLARLADTDFAPIQNASVHAVVVSGEKRVARIALQYRPDSNGMYEAMLDPLPIGEYTVSLECKAAERRLGSDYPEELETRFSVVTAKRPAEFVHATADWTVPRTMARLSGGSAVAPSGALELWDQFGEGSGLVVERVETNLWDSPWLFLAIVGFLTAEWLLRKKGGLA